MTAAKIVDASAAVALIFDEPESAQIAAAIADARPIAPTLLAFELANACWKKCQRHPEQREGYLAAYRLGGRFMVEEAPVDLQEVVQLALDTGLTVYDASYLWLSRHLNAELVTLDKRLAAAAEASA